MLIDSHAHILYDNLDANQIVKNMKQDNLEKIVTIGTNALNSQKALDFASKNRDIYCAVGIHPEYASEVSQSDLDLIDKLAGGEKVVAIGEIGLDYHENSENKERQKEVFIKQLEIAIKHDLPVCIHTRDAAWDTYWILKEYSKKLRPSVMHCFSENAEFAKLFLNLGFYISFSGNITFKKSDRSFLKDIPIDKILVETDCPFLSPEPLRGRVNEPKNVAYTAQRIADEICMDFEKFCEHTVENTKNVYTKLR